MQLLDRYAQLIVKVGANVQPNQPVTVMADVAHAPVVRAVAAQAWQAGASRVDVYFDDGLVRRAALEYAPMQALTTAPEWQLERIRRWEETQAAVIRLTGNPDPHVFDGIDPARIAAHSTILAKQMSRVLLGGLASWTIVAAPNPGWAQQVFGEPDVDRLWDAIAGPLRLRADDVAAAWAEHRGVLAARARALMSLELDSVRYFGGGTDLTVGLLPGCRWLSGAERTRFGVEFMPNLPTEEVFTSPDRRRADGVIRLTRPLVMPRAGVLVEGLVVTFSDGRIVDVVASTGVDAVRAELETDSGVRSLGEVALVDGGSLVRAAGLIFHDTLYDENAGSHVAWGLGFPMALAGGVEMGPDELFAAGINASAVHTDVVIGGPGVNVEGRTSAGQVVPIISDDAWVLPTEAA
jgi:aminopeptidase